MATRGLSSDEQAKLGDGWWDVAEKQAKTAQRSIKARALYWYQEALPSLSGLVKDNVEKRLAEYEPVPAKPPGPSPGPNKASAVTIAGLFQVKLTEQDTKKTTLEFWDFRPDKSVWNRKSVKQIATWKPDGLRIEVDFSDKAWHPLKLQRK